MSRLHELIESGPDPQHSRVYNHIWVDLIINDLNYTTLYELASWSFREQVQTHNIV